MRVFVLARHGESELNVTRRVNGDPAVEVALTAAGEDQARSLGEQLANVPIAVCVHTRFDRTRHTAAIALVGRAVPFVVEPLLDDVDVGDLEGQTLSEYRSWKRAHTRGDPFPGGESLDGPAHDIRNCVPYLFDNSGLRRAIEGIDRLTASSAVA